MKYLPLLLTIVLYCIPWSASSADQTTANEAWEKVLTSFVDAQGRTDFVALARSSDDLESFVAYVAAHGPNSDPSVYDTPAKVLAFHINAYNALAMHGVIEKGIPAAFDGILKRARFFKFRKIRVDGKPMSLSAYENDIIRPLGDPRVHFALNCMVIDCPRLPRRPFVANTLNETLDRLTREFFNHKKHLRTVASKKRVLLSSILKFYTSDFASSGSRKDLIPYINQFRDDAIPTNWDVEFMDYDWTVNQAPTH